MEYGYYPGCSLTGSARKLDWGVRALAKRLGHVLTDIPDWNCCGAMEYGDRKELLALSAENLEKAESLSREIVAPCPACYKNLKDADVEGRFSIVHPLELLEGALAGPIKAQRDVKGKIFTPYYGCLLLRPEGTALKNKNIMEELISSLDGEIEGQRIKDRCCGGNQFFVNKWATEKLSAMIMEKSRGIMVVHCPLCHMALKTFSTGRKVIYLTDLLLYVMGEKNTL